MTKKDFLIDYVLRRASTMNTASFDAEGAVIRANDAWKRIEQLTASVDAKRGN